MTISEPEQGGGGSVTPDCSRANTKILDFLQEHGKAARRLEQESGVPWQFILAWSGIESGNGADPTPTQNGNYFGLTLPRGGTTGGWIGAVACVPNAVPGHACFASDDNFYASGYAALFSHDRRNLDRMLEAMKDPMSTAQSIFDATASKAPNMQFNTSPTYGARIQHYYATSMAPFEGCF